MASTDNEEKITDDLPAVSEETDDLPPSVSEETVSVTKPNISVPHGRSKPRGGMWKVVQDKLGGFNMPTGRRGAPRGGGRRMGRRATLYAWPGDDDDDDDESDPPSADDDSWMSTRSQPKESIRLGPTSDTILESERRQGQVTIFVRVVFLKLGEIDTANERFSADAFVQAKWREPALDGESRGAEFEVLNRAELWDPKLYVENAMGELKESVWYIVSYDLQGRATIYQRRRVKGTFFERMELNQFPFDTQDLTLTLSSERGEQEMELNMDEGEISTVNVQSFVDEQEWVLHKHINSWKRVTTNAYKSTRHKHPAISIACTATRRSRFFIWNIILVMMFICTLVFTTFTVDQDKPQNRLQLAFILLLSNITFKFTVNQALPKVSYLTYLDKYILLSMAIQCLVCVWHAVVSQLIPSYGASFAENIDKYALVSLLALYIIFNFIFFTWSKCLIARRSKEYSQKDLKQKEKLKRMEADANSPHSVVPM